MPGDDARTAAVAARSAITTLLAERAAGATICPSEAARRLAGTGDWRAAMPLVHAAVDALIAEGAVRLSWRGRSLDARDGPYRIADTRPSPTDHSAAGR